MIRFLALGDSYTVGESIDPSLSWPSQLAEQMADRVEITVVATTGSTSRELLDALDQDPPAGAFDLISLSIGVNDQYRGLPLEDFAANADVLLNRAGGHRGDRGTMFVVSIPDWGPTPFAAGRDRRLIGMQIDAFNTELAAAAARHSVPFVDVTRISRQSPEDVADDGLHPSGDQYRRWVEVIAPVVEELLSP